MARSKLNEQQKNRVVELFHAKVKQVNIAKYFSVHPRTINRVLIEKGLVESPEARVARQSQLLAICEEFKMTPETLRNRLTQPELTLGTLRHVLGNLDPGQLGALIHSSISEAVIQQLERRSQGIPVEQEALPV